IIVVVDELLKADALFPKMWVLTNERYQELMDRITALERQLKADKKLVSSCNLSGKLEGDFLVFRAEFKFSTEQAKTTVVLGLQGGHLTDDGELDRQAAIPDYTDDGFVVRVEKEGNHQLTLNFRVPVQIEKS